MIEWTLGVLLCALECRLCGSAETANGCCGQEGNAFRYRRCKEGTRVSGYQSPYQLVEKMRAAGHKAEIKEHKAGSRPAVEVRVPSGISTYVRQELGAVPTNR